MGLDVFLHRYNDLSAFSRWEALTSKEEEKIWEREGLDYSDQKAEVEAMQERVRVALGLTKAQTEHTKVEQSSVKHPDHLFKVGYFRSSYNEGGINHIFRESIGSSGLYEIFPESQSNEFKFRPDWNGALSRVHDLRTRFQAWIAQYGLYSIEKVDANVFMTQNETPGSPKEAMERFVGVVERNKDRKGPIFPGEDPNRNWFSCREGTFWLGTPRKILAATMGFRDFGNTKFPCAYLLVEQEPGHYEWYVKALDIVEETIEWVLVQPDPSVFCLHWSS